MKVYSLLSAVFLVPFGVDGNDRDVLELLYDTCNGDGWYKKKNWKDSNKIICEWEGITCANNNSEESVQMIDLDTNNVKGYVPFLKIFKMPLLRALKLGGNPILYKKPGDYDNDGAISGITSDVTLLDLSNTNLQGLEYIFEWVNFRELTDLYLNDNDLFGPFPEKLYTLENTLQRLSLEGNNLSRMIPSKVTDFVKLRYLNLAHNEFTGSFPASLDRLYRLKYLLLGGNSLSGSIPREIESFYFLKELDLSGQTAGITGKLPAFASLTNLERLNLSSNRISGTIPKNFLSAVNEKKFQFAFLGSNQLSGTIPFKPLMRLPEGSISVENNQITGIHPGLCNSQVTFGCDAILCPTKTYSNEGRQEEENSPCQPCETAKYFGSVSCFDDSTLYPTFSPVSTPIFPTMTDRDILASLYDNCNGISWTHQDNWKSVNSPCTWYGITCTEQQIQQINLSNNNLKEAIPTTLYLLPNLENLSLSHNSILIDFTGIENARYLETMDLQDTNIFSVAGISLAPTLNDLDLSSNAFEGKFPEELLFIEKLQTLRINRNKISGTIPEKVSQLAYLRILFANENELTGELPDSLMSLTELEQLSLHSNNLIGPLTEILEPLNSLHFIDLSRNRFTGDIPTFATNINVQQLDLHDNKLSGTIPHEFLSSANKKFFRFADLSSNSISGTIPDSLERLENNVYFSDNLITGISEPLCKNLGCDGVLCAPGTFHSEGRQTSYITKCETCEEAVYYGAITCPPRNHTDTSPSGSSDEEPRTIMSERDILETFYRKLKGDQWTTNTGWMNETIGVCSWFGIRCNVMGLVDEVSLKSNKLEGDIPREIFDLPALTSIVLDSNHIEFDFRGIEKATHLTSIELGNTDVESFVGIEKSLTLKSLSLPGCNLRGHIDELVQLRGLQRLVLNFNALSGTIPPSFANLVDLQYLSIHDNHLSGNIPSTIGNLKELEVIIAQNNNFSGTIPSEFSSMSSLRYINLSSQKGFGGDGFTGTIPAFNDITNIALLDFSSNSLSGELPKDILANAELEDFTYIRLSDNKLEGKLPETLARFPAEGLYLENNQFTGIAPELCSGAFGCDGVLCKPYYYNKKGKQESDGDPCTLCLSQVSNNNFYGNTFCGTSSNPTQSPVHAIQTEDKDEAEILKKFYNQCSGKGWIKSDNWMDDSVSICKWFGVICVEKDGGSHVQSIMLSGNKVFGTPPQDLFSLKYLETLVLSDNPILFDFTEIGNALMLSYLDLSSTGIASIEGIAAAKKLKELELAQNDLAGSIPPELFTMQTLERLVLDTNQLTGELSSSIGDMVNLRLFSCQSNKLRGHLPSSIGNIKNLVNLHLQNNNFSGAIPSELGRLAKLGYIDLSKQKVFGGSGFTGSLPNFSELPSLRRIDLSFNSISGSIPSSFLQSSRPFSVVSLIDLRSNNLSGKAPSLLASYEEVHLEDNKITEIDESLCAKYLDCDEFLCPPKTFNHAGSNKIGAECESCETSNYYGATKCDDIKPADDSRPPNKPNIYTTSSPTYTAAYPPNTPSPVSQRTSSPTKYAPPGSYMSDKDILIKFYKDCEGERWRKDDNWLSSKSICEWAGITCVEGTEQVQKISLGANNLKGIPPVELYQLKSLESLVLYSNNLGSFNFKYIKEATNLKELVLDDTKIEDVRGIEKAPNLRVVKLRFNKVRGNIGDLTELKSLEYLSCSNNDLTGTVPSDFDNLKKLKTLLLGNNHLEGNLRNVRFPGSLEILDLSRNDITGEIPSHFLTEFKNSAQLVVDLSENELEGEVPSSLSRFKSLELMLRDNKFTSVSSELCSLEGWNRGDVGQFGCSALLCPKGKSAPSGRQTMSNKCTACKEASYLGSSKCHTTSSGYRKETSFWLSALLFLLSIIL